MQKIYYHRIGTPQSDHRLFYQNPSQPLRFYEVSVNKEETVMYLTEAGMDNGNNLYVRDMTQADLAAAVGVSRQTINAIEKGEYNPTINLCRSICKVLGKTLDELFWEE